jgi:hypothetical protein
MSNENGFNKETFMQTTRLPLLTAARRPLWGLLAAVAVAAALGGCDSIQINENVASVTRGFKPHMQQVLDNVAHFTEDPGTWPSHVLVYRGAFETKGEWNIDIGVPGGLGYRDYSMTRWELSNLDDPYDLRRVRLLYQWQVGYIKFEQLEQAWNEIRDRPLLDGAGKPVLGNDGRPIFFALALPVTRDTKRNWTTKDLFAALGSMSGTSGTPAIPGTVTIWVTDTDAAAQFSLAILTAMPNTRVKARWGDATMAIP